MYFSGGWELWLPIVEPTVFATKYTLDGNIYDDYVQNDDVKTGHIIQDIRRGKNSPWYFFTPILASYFIEPLREYYWDDTAAAINEYSYIYEDMRRP